MELRKRLLKVAESTIKEGVESSKNIISNNVVPSFEDMGMASVTPGEFAKEEITDSENLVNKGTMSNDTEFNKEETANPVEDMLNTAKDALDGFLNISEPKDDKAIEIVKTEVNTTPDGEECGCHHDHLHKHDHDAHSTARSGLFGESGMGKIIESVMGGKSCEDYLKTLTESDYAGPLDFVPDTRINFTDVMNKIKSEVGEGAEGVHVDVEVDKDNNNVYKVSQIDTDKLPKELHVENIVLKLDGNTYIPNKMAKDFPLKTSKN